LAQGPVAQADNSHEHISTTGLLCASTGAAIPDTVTICDEVALYHLIEQQCGRMP